MTRKSRLPAPKFAFAQKTTREADSLDSENVSPLPEALESREVPRNNIPAKVDYTRITTQLISQNDRKLEYAVLILGRKKQDLINELLADGLDRLNISFPQL